MIYGRFVRNLNFPKNVLPTLVSFRRPDHNFLTKPFTKMKKILYYLAASLLFANLFISTGCTDDPIIDPVKDAPLLLLGSSSEVADGGTFTVEQSNATTLSFTLIASVGTDPLNTLKIAGISDLNDLTVTGNASGIGSNTVLLSGADRSGFTWDVVYTLDNTIGDKTISFEVADEGGLVDGISFTVSVIPDPGTPIDMTLTGVLFNQAGPAGKGTLDLDEGKSAGVTTTGDTTPDQAEIRDMGLDCTIPAPGFNWRRQIGAFNGTELRKVDLTQVENFTFDNVDIVEDIQNAFDTGITFAAGEAKNCVSGANTAVQHVSSVLAVNDLLVVKKGTKYYLIRVDEVNENGTDNNDTYVFSIKHGSL